tara:strand:+ start:54 stop:1253 length:1200 start_codon:yes stop_codon:yes gene_type:complete
MSVITGMFFYADAGTAYAVQFISGGDKMITTQGIKLKYWGRVIPLSYEISIKDIIVDDKDELPDDGQGIYNRQAQRWEFSDAIKAEISTSVIVGVNINDEDVFLNMADRNKSEGKLIFGRVLPNIDAAIKNTCKLMDAQDYISGQASDFDRYFRDQLENGMYQVEQYYEDENINEIVGDTTTVRQIKVGKSSKQKKFRIKKDSDGNIVRDNSNSLKQYGLKIYQAQVTGIDWEESFDERLDLQKNEVAQTQLEKQQAEREYYRAKKEVAKGESEKAKERARLEKIQIQQTIEAETEAKVAGFNLIKEKKQYEVELYKAKSKKVAADAQYYENAKLVSAGLTPQEKAEWEYKTAVGVAQQLKELNLPQTYIEGSKSGNGGNLLESLIGAELAKNMIKKKN